MRTFLLGLQPRNYHFEGGTWFRRPKNVLILEIFLSGAIEVITVEFRGRFFMYLRRWKIIFS